MTSTTISTQAHRRFEENKNNPVVKSLATFITMNLQRSLHSVASWGVEATDKPERSFYLRFADGTCISGTLREVWQVEVYDYQRVEVEGMQEP